MTRTIPIHPSPQAANPAGLQGDRIVALGAHLLREGEQVRVADLSIAAAAEGVRP